MPKKQTTKGAAMSDETVVVEATEVKVAAPASPKEATLVRLSPYDKKIAEYQQYLTLKVQDADDKAGAKKIDDARKEVKRTKIEAEKVGKEIIAPFNEVVKAINARRSEVEKSLKGIEDHLQAECDRYDEMVEERRLEEEAAAEAKFKNRIDQILTIGAEWNGYSAYKIGEISASLIDVRQLPDEDFIDLTTKMEEEYERQRIAKEEKEAEEKARQAEREAEQKRIADENKKLAKEKADLQKQLDDMKKSQQAAADKAAKEKADKDAADAAEKAEADKLRRQTEFNFRHSELTLYSVTLDEEAQIFMYEDAAVSSVSDVKEMTAEAWAEFMAELPNDIQRYKDQVEEEKRKKEEADAAAEAAREKEAQAEKDRLEALEPDKAKLLKLLSKLKKECSGVYVKTGEALVVLDSLRDSISEYDEVINNLK
jgi:hypothetical protein